MNNNKTHLYLLDYLVSFIKKTTFVNEHSSRDTHVIKVRVYFLCMKEKNFRFFSFYYLFIFDQMPVD